MLERHHPKFFQKEVRMIGSLSKPFLSLLLGGLCLAANTDPAVPVEKYAKYRENFPFVVEIEGRFKDGESFVAEAVAIDPHWFLTSASQVSRPLGSCHIKVKGEKKKVEYVQIHESWAEFEPGSIDLAIGHVAEDIGLDAYPELYDKFDEQGKECSISGCYHTGTLDRGATHSRRMPLMGKGKVAAVRNQYLEIAPSVEGATDMDLLIFKGDSGGGLFIEGMLAGIHSQIMKTGLSPHLSRYGDSSVHTRISTNIKWINSIRRKK